MLTESFELDRELALYDTSLSPLVVHCVFLQWSKQENQIIECRINFQVNPEIYQRIDQQCIFNLKPEVRSPAFGNKFLADIDIYIQATLKPDILPQLLAAANNIETAANYLLNLSQQQVADLTNNHKDLHPLLNTENWLSLSVKQPQESGEAGYVTFWHYLNPSTINQPDTTSEQISTSIVNFFKEWTENHLSATTQNFTTEILNSIGNVFQELARDNIPEIPQKPTSSQSIFEIMVNFFGEDDWSFVQNSQASALTMAFQGENGRWNCFAKAREAEQEFVFYSISPINVPENQKPAIAEFITRANSGMIIGNFELNWQDGEICYKTSIDVEGDRLTSALVKRLVYANVAMMDLYLPGIIMVIAGDVSPASAIAQIES